MKVVAFNGSPRKKGNTTGCLTTVFKELNKIHHPIHLSCSMPLLRLEWIQRSHCFPELLHAAVAAKIDPGKLALSTLYIHPDCGYNRLCPIFWSIQRGKRTFVYSINPRLYEQLL